MRVLRRKGVSRRIAAPSRPTNGRTPLWSGAAGKSGGQSGAAGGGGIGGGRVEGSRFGLSVQRQSDKNRAGEAVASGNDVAAQMDMRAAGDGFLEIGQPETP